MCAEAGHAHVPAEGHVDEVSSSARWGCCGKMRPLDKGCCGKMRPLDGDGSDGGCGGWTRSHSQRRRLRRLRRQQRRWWLRRWQGWWRCLHVLITALWWRRWQRWWRCMHVLITALCRWRRWQRWWRCMQVLITALYRVPYLVVRGRPWLKRTCPERRFHGRHRALVKCMYARAAERVPDE